MKKLEKLLLALSIIFFIYSCGSSTQTENEDPETTSSESTESTDESTEEEEEEQPQLSEVALKGEQLFKVNCSTCHYMDNEDLIGPGLKGVTKRLEKEWILKFIRNSQEVIASGDEYAVELYEKYNKGIMTSFDWPEEDLEAVYAYMDEMGSDS